MTWTALLPVKPNGSRKTRLAGSLDMAARDALVDRMLERALDAVAATPRVSRVLVLSRAPPADGRAGWIADHGRGLNAELTRVVATIAARPLLVLFPDLPLIGPEDLRALLEAAEPTGLALAADRHGRGTNALAIADDRALRFQFGEDSLGRFVADAAGSACIVRRPGLALDCDTAEDLGLALAAS